MWAPSTYPSAICGREKPGEKGKHSLVKLVHKMQIRKARKSAGKVQLGNIVVGLLFPSGCFAFKAAHTYLFLSYYTNLNI